MSTIERIRRLTGGQKRTDPNGGRSEELKELRRRIDAVMSRRPGSQAHARPIETGASLSCDGIIDGEELHNDGGTFFAALKRVTSGNPHGFRCPDELTGLDMRRAALLTGDLQVSAAAVTDALFLDTETTGLAGGAGTMAFLIGLGWLEGSAFVTEQLFARDFREERAALHHLRERAKEKRFLVTFNGKSFDVNLLANRFIMNRMPDPLSGMPHLDLLHPARRLLGHRLPDSRLVTIEEKVLGFERDGDVPGHEIPQRYFDWLRRRDPRLMADVFEHNRLDVVSLAVLMVHLAELLDSDARGVERDHGDILAAARLLLDRKHRSGALGHLEVLLSRCGDAGVRYEARVMLSLLYKREGRWDRAVELWESMLRETPADVFASVELAKWYEHRVCDFERALALVSGVLDGSGSLEGHLADALLHRLDRLRRRRETGRQGEKDVTVSGKKQE